MLGRTRSGDVGYGRVRYGEAREVLIFVAGSGMVRFGGV